MLAMSWDKMAPAVAATMQTMKPSIRPQAAPAA